MQMKNLRHYKVLGVCVCVFVWMRGWRELHLCGDTHHSACHQLKQNIGEILIKALSEPCGLAEVNVCVHVRKWAQVYLK